MESLISIILGIIIGVCVYHLGLQRGLGISYDSKHGIAPGENKLELPDSTGDLEMDID